MTIAEIALIFSGVGVLFGVLTYVRNGKKDAQTETTSLVEVKAQLGYISRGIDDIKINDRLRDTQMKTLSDTVLVHDKDIQIIIENRKEDHDKIEKLEDVIKELKKKGE